MTGGMHASHQENVQTSGWDVYVPFSIFWEPTKGLLFPFTRTSVSALIHFFFLHFHFDVYMIENKCF